MHASVLLVSISTRVRAMSSRASQVLACIYLAAAETIVITVTGGNSTSDGTAVFDPQRVVAVLGDIVLFNCKLFFRFLSTGSD